MSSDREGGFAVPFAVAMMALFATLSLQLLLEAREGRRAEASQFELDRGRYAAEGAIYRVIYALISPSEALKVPLDGTPIEVALGGKIVVIRTITESAKIDINRSNSDVLSSLFQALGEDPDDAAALAGHVVAWRQSSPQFRSEEAAAYAAAGRRYSPIFGPFRTIEDVNLVLGMSDRLAEKMSKVATVWSSDGGVDRSAAPDLVLHVLAAANDGLARSELDARSAGALRHSWRSASPGEVVSISASLKDSNRSIGCRVLVALRWDQSKPFELLWRQWFAS